MRGPLLVMEAAVYGSRPTKGEFVTTPTRRSAQRRGDVVGALRPAAR
jgi:hypothetical protein